MSPSLIGSWPMLLISTSSGRTRRGAISLREALVHMVEEYAGIPADVTAAGADRRPDRSIGVVRRDHLSSKRSGKVIAAPVKGVLTPAWSRVGGAATALGRWDGLGKLE